MEGGREGKKVREAAEGGVGGTYVSRGGRGAMLPGPRGRPAGTTPARTRGRNTMHATLARFQPGNAHTHRGRDTCTRGQRLVGCGRGEFKGQKTLWGMGEGPRMPETTFPPECDPFLPKYFHFRAVFCVFVSLNALGRKFFHT